MADAKKPTKPKGRPDHVVFDAAKAKGTKGGKAQAAFAAAAAVEEDGHAGHGEGGHRRRRLLLRRACCGLAVTVTVVAALILVLSLTVLRVRDPTLSMDSVQVKHFHVDFGSEGGADDHYPLQINVTLVAGIVIRNPNYESMRFGASTTEITIDGVAERVGLGSAPPGVVSARGTSRVRAGVDVFVDRVATAVVGDVLFGGGEVRLASHTAVDGRISVLGGLYGRRTVRVAMRCRVVLHVSPAVVVAGSPSCVAEFGR